ncbi:DUF421 domain-containing protein [Flavitalea sp.]|nr:DUF421 domain-containing protein [Flavitalea sp.]
MFILQASDGFDWYKFLMGEEEWVFIGEVIFRSAIMFIVALSALRILGKRGVRQISIFELVVIITLGSAAGDPMFYKDVGILPALGVFIVIVSLYYFVTYLVGKNKRFERLIEGKPVCLIQDGRFSVENFKKEALAQDEFFAELRVKGISQLGQVEQAIIETNGDISIFHYPDDKVKPGLPILPRASSEQETKIDSAGIYSCTFCGNTESFETATAKYVCKKCKKEKWVKASTRKRVT